MGDTEQLPAGTQIGPYRVVRPLGSGGMGVVYEVRHERVNQRAAVKLLAARGGGGIAPAKLRRFLIEVEALGRLEHPGLVRVLDCGETSAHGPWLAMDLVPGESLRRRLDAKEALSPAEVVPIVRRIASAVAAMHRAGVVHRDLKPDNIMLAPDDEVPGGERVVLVDFGVAKLLDGNAVTTEGTVLGTAGYMAPEQCVADRDIDGKADVYAIGVIAFELLCGARPFLGDTRGVIAQHLFSEPPLARLDGVPEDIVQLVAELLRKEPSLRPDIDQLVARARSLEDAPPHALRPRAFAPLAAETVSTRATARRPSRLPVLAIGAGAAALTVVASLLAWRVLRARSDTELPAIPELYAPPAELLPTEMVPIEEARFAMGSTRDEITAACTLPGGCLPAELPQLERELPAHDVTVTAFSLDRHEVTNEQFAAFLNIVAALVDVRPDRDDNSLRFVDDRESKRLLVDLSLPYSGIAYTGERFAVRLGHAKRPVVKVTWDGADRYCRQLGRRLPTEAEWELAARGGLRRRFPWGDEPPRCDGVAFGWDAGERGCPQRTEPIAVVATSTQDVTPEGVFDLAGNVGEWVQDQLVVPYDTSCGACRDPVVETVSTSVRPEDEFRVFRGGTFYGVPSNVRGATRSRWKRTQPMDGVGFRCATR